MDIEKVIYDFIETNDESLPMIYDMIRTITVQVIVQILFTMNNPSVSLMSITFIQTTLFLILGIMIFWLIIYKFISTNYLNPLFQKKTID
jgi:hypothetical protein|tara:strand:+ start:207 stop:476 length:270 start_codon:yes stop_codon:yes gene_type:complete